MALTFSVIVGTRADLAVTQGGESGLLALLLGLLAGIVVVGAVAALAMIPSAAGGAIVGALLLDDRATLARAAIEGVELILLDDVDEFGGIVGILGISAVAQPLGPTAVIGHVKFIEHAIARALEELGMIQEGVFGGIILAVTHRVGRVATAIDLSGPMIGLDAEVVVGFDSHLALTDTTLEQSLSQGDASRHSILFLVLQRYLLVTLNIVQTELLTRL